MRLCAGHPRGVLQVPFPSYQLPGPRPRPGPGKPSFFASFTGRGQRGAAAPGLTILLIRHRRDPVTQPKHRARESRTPDDEERRKDHIHVIRKGVYLLLLRCIVSIEELLFSLSLPPRLLLGSPLNRMDFPLHGRKLSCLPASPHPSSEMDHMGQRISSSCGVLL
uniref:Uncharacterized protein n=1 Tax=Triticum urartu TaxID=4572 RepID=A0A8R7TID3_TRIUA